MTAVFNEVEKSNKSVTDAKARRISLSRASATRRWASWSWGAAGFVMILLAWQLIVVLGNMRESTLPSPVAVMASMWDNRSILRSATFVTMREIAIGFALASLAGVLLAVALASSRVIYKLAYPSLVLLNSIPKVSIAPLFLIWFGFGATTNAMLATTIAVFPVIINTVLGLTGVSDDFLRLGRVMGGNAWRVFFRIRFPSALPSIFAGLKLATSFATIGAIVGEFIAGQNGLGYIAQISAGRLDTPLTFASIVIMSTLGLLFFYAIAIIEWLCISGRRTRVE